MRTGGVGCRGERKKKRKMVKMVVGAGGERLKRRWVLGTGEGWGALLSTFSLRSGLSPIENLYTIQAIITIYLQHKKTNTKNKEKSHPVP